MYWSLKMFIKITYIWRLCLIINSYHKFLIINSAYFFPINGCIWSLLRSTVLFLSLKWQSSTVLGRFSICACDYFVSFQLNNLLCSHFLPCFLKISNAHVCTHTPTHTHAQERENERERDLLFCPSLKNILFANIRTLERRQFLYSLYHTFVLLPAHSFVCSPSMY